MAASWRWSSFTPAYSELKARWRASNGQGIRRKGGLTLGRDIILRHQQSLCSVPNRSNMLICSCTKHGWRRLMHCFSAVAGCLGPGPELRLVV